jgi:S-formylglutathione hydrolase FrmB
VAKELVDWIDTHYATFKIRENRAILGHSMGGHGALSLAMKYPERFGIACAMSGGVDLTYSTTEWGIAKALGKFKEKPENWYSNSVINLIDNIKDIPMKLFFECGKDDFFIDVNRNLHQKMLQRKIPHEYTERPGEHNWSYWENAIDYQFLFISKSFKR